MKTFKQSLIIFATVFAGICFIACSDANEYEDADTQNPSWVNGYNDSLKIQHPESMAGTYWVRASGLKTNANGEEIQGYVESIDFVDDKYAVVKMSEGQIPASIKNTTIWVDDSNTEATPQYEYIYSSVTGIVEIQKRVVDENKKVSNVTIFSAVAVSGQSEILTVAHFGDTPVQTYLVRGQKPDEPANDGDTTE